MNKQLQIVIDAMAPSLRNQLAQQGFSMEDNDIIHYQELLNDVMRLEFHHVLTKGECDKVYRRLTKLIARDIINKE